MEQKYYTAKEAAEYLGVHRNTIMTWRKDGLIAPVIWHRSLSLYTQQQLDSMSKKKERK